MFTFEVLKEQSCYVLNVSLDLLFGLCKYIWPILFFILLMFKDVTGFIVKLIMVNKCWLPTDAHFVFVLLHFPR